MLKFIGTPGTNRGGGVEGLSKIILLKCQNMQRIIACKHSTPEMNIHSRNFWCNTWIFIIDYSHWQREEFIKGLTIQSFLPPISDFYEPVHIEDFACRNTNRKNKILIDWYNLKLIFKKVKKNFTRLNICLIKQAWDYKLLEMILIPDVYLMIMLNLQLVMIIQSKHSSLIRTVSSQLCKNRA